MKLEKSLIGIVPTLCYNDLVWDRADHILCVSYQIVCVCVPFSFHFEGGIWDLIVLVPDHCLSFYFDFT